MLNFKKKMFAKEYLVDLNATQAAIRAGYSKYTAYSQGQRLLKSAEIIAIVSQEQRKREERTEINADYVLTNLRDIAEACKSDNPNVANKSLELLGKNLKLFTDRLEIRVIGCWEDLSDGEQQNILDKMGEGLKRLE